MQNNTRKSIWQYKIYEGLLCNWGMIRVHPLAEKRTERFRNVKKGVPSGADIYD